MTKELIIPLFADEEIERILKDETLENKANYLAGSFNVKLNMAKAAYTTVAKQLDSQNVNYARALGQIDGLKYGLDVANKQIATLNEPNKNEWD